MSATAKVIKLSGDPKSPESAEHHILFPGGSISVCRTSNDEYWAHIYVNHEEKQDDTVHQKIGKIESIRKEQDNHFAVLISTK
jgi:hypothetical protein